jgi:hypothetical protein
MQNKESINFFLSQYDKGVYSIAIQLRKIVLENLPDIIEQPDIPAKMIAYCYGRKYSEIICTIIPSKNGVKLGFYKGNELPDLYNLLEGKGKISRDVDIKSEEQIKSAAIKQLFEDAFAAYKKRIEK